MKTHLKRLIESVLVGCTVIFATWDTHGLGSDYSNDRPVIGSAAWPKGMAQLVNITNRVHGFFVNAEDLFFFSGSASNFTVFLKNYSQTSGIEKHRLILHEGMGEAKSPWEKTGRACDWKLYGCPKGWSNLAALKDTNSVEAMQKAAQEPGYVLEVHFWTGGRIGLDQIVVPQNVEIAKGK
jgi:hypothetical protein